MHMEVRSAVLRHLQELDLPGADNRSVITVEHVAALRHPAERRLHVSGLRGRHGDDRSDREGPDGRCHGLGDGQRVHSRHVSALYSA